MSDVFIPFLICALGGFSTTIGGFIAIYINIDNLKKLQGVFAVSSGIIVGISILCLVPEGYSMIQLDINRNFSIIILVLAVLLGVVISRLVDYLFETDAKEFDDKHIFKTGILIMIGLIIHNFPEGMITFITSINDINMGILVSIGIMLHNIPEGILISLPIYFVTRNKKKAILYSFLSGMAEPLGAVFAMVFIKHINSNVFMGIVTYMVAGFMLNMGLNTILIKNYKDIGLFKSGLFFLLGLLIIVPITLLMK